MQGKVFALKDDQLYAQLSEPELNDLKYNGRIESANRYHIESAKGKAALARLFNVNMQVFSILHVLKFAC